MRIVIVLSCIIVLIFLFMTIQVPTIDVEIIENVINNVLSISEDKVENEAALKKTVILIVKQLETDQQTRLKYLVAAYIVIWLVFMLYLVRLGKQQQVLDQRLAQLEQDPSDEGEPVINSNTLSEE